MAVNIDDPLWRTAMIRLVLLIATSIFSSVGSANAQQELRVGLMNAEPGVISKDSQLRGRDIDIWDAIAKDTGLRVTYVLVSSPSALLAALDEGKVDTAGWTSTTAAKYLLTDTILPTAEALIVPKADTRTYHDLGDIKHLKFATLAGSDYANYLRKSGISEIKEFNSLPDVLKTITSGEVNAAMFSGIIAGYMEKEGNLPGLQVVRSYQPALSRPVVAAFPKAASESYNRVNASLKKLHADGTMAKIKAMYGL
jgi:polar amino acid transport system substrate-binding protein